VPERQRPDTRSVAAAPREPDLSAYPVAAVPALRQISGNLLNEYDWGGYLIRYAPEHRTFIDGRGEALFLPDVLDDFQRVEVQPAHEITRSLASGAMSHGALVATAHEAVAESLA